MKRSVAILLYVFAVAGSVMIPATSRAGQYSNFNAAIYIPASVVMSFADSNKLNADWERISRQLKFDKVYVEVQRNRTLVPDALLEQVKGFFHGKGIRTAAGMALSDGGGGQFRSFCYTDPEDRAFIKQAAERSAKHFDEIIQDDFFFVTTKFDSDIAAKGDRTWTQFRLDLMNEAAESLLLKPARAVNPKVKHIIKFPNWYEHFHGSGFDLEKEPLLFDGIYTGTETRDPETTDQNLQQYESYQIFRYFENIAPGRNGGGWVDTFSIRYIDRYAEQLWNTLFAKASEITLFEWSAMSRPIRAGDREQWKDLTTGLNLDAVVAGYKASAPAASQPEPTIALIAGNSMEQVDAFLGRLGRPIGIASYRPHHSWGEDFLHNYFGMIGIPIDLHPVFPTNASTVLLTESAAHDKEIVSKIKGQLTAGRSVVITSGLLRALQGNGIEEIVELQYTDRKVSARKYLDGFGAGDGQVLGPEDNEPVLMPDIRFLTNDAWPILRALAGGRGYPLMLMERYGKGVLYVWTMPDNFNDLYLLPAEVISAIKRYVMADFPVRLEAPAQVALFAYDNDIFIVQSYLPATMKVAVTLPAGTAKIRNIVTGEERTGRIREQGRQRGGGERRVAFEIDLLPHSYQVFAVEK
jgi:hypothetical protein